MCINKIILNSINLCKLKYYFFGDFPEIRSLLIWPGQWLNAQPPHGRILGPFPHAKMPHKDIDPKGFHGSVERRQNGLPVATSPKLRLFSF